MNVPSPSGTPRLSLAMIVKDEAPRLSDCLAHLQGFSDELVVVDTGSTDGTQDIAADFGCRVATFRWRDDFAAARNAAHRQCSGAWIFVLDPDERIAPADQQAIRALAAQAPVKAYRFITRNYTNARDRNDFVPASPGDPDARGFAGWYPSAKVRLYPNRPEIRFEGAVHELVNHALERLGIPIETAPQIIHHYPLLRSEDEIARKQRLYVELGRKKVATAPEDPAAHAELGRQYAEVGDYDQAVARYREAVRLDPKAAWLKELGTCLYLAGHSVQAEQALCLAVDRDPTLPDAWRNLGVIHAHRQAWQEARACFEQGLEQGPTDSELHRYMALALEQLGTLEAAADHAGRAVRYDPGNPEARALYEEQMNRLGRSEEARAFLMKRQGEPESPAGGR